jgi:hypothetical protein
MCFGDFGSFNQQFGQEQARPNHKPQDDKVQMRFRTIRMVTLRSFNNMRQENGNTKSQSCLTKKKV